MNNKDIWDEYEFESWLRVGIESVVLNDQNQHAFPGAEYRILQARGDIGLGLGNFSDNLSPKRRDAFKKAFALVLTSLEPRKEYVPVAKKLLIIASEVSATPILKVLPQKIGQGFFGKPDSEDGKSLFNVAIYSIVKMATASRNDAYNCLIAMIGTDIFSFAHAGVTLIGLCQIYPDNLAEHLDVPKMRKTLENQFEKGFSDKLSPSHMIALHILETIGLKKYTQMLNKIGVFRIGHITKDKWLVHELIECETAPLKISDDGKFIYYKSKSGTRYPLVCFDEKKYLVSDAAIYGRYSVNKDNSCLVPRISKLKQVSVTSKTLH